MRKRISVLSTILLAFVMMFSACSLPKISTKTLTGLAITTEPTLKVYTVGEFFDKAGMVVEASYSDGVIEAVKDYTVTPTGALSVADTGVTISYKDKKVVQAITVNPQSATLTNIAIKKAPIKTSYYIGELFDNSGMVVEAIYSDNTSSEITDYTIYPSGALTANTTAVHILYGDKTAQQAISILSATVQSIVIAKAPTTTTYYEGNMFSTDGMLVKAVMSDGSEQFVSNYNYSPQTALLVSDTKIKITYGNKTVQQAIAIISIKNIDITQAPSKTIYTEGKAFNPSGMEVKAFYGDGSNALVVNYDYSPKTSLLKSNTYVTVSLGGKTAQQAIIVSAGSKKRGVGYNFTTNETESSSTTQTEFDMDMLMGGENGVNWFYNWGAGQNSEVATQSKARDLSYIPMTWRYLNDRDEATIRDFVAANPSCEYILACNEPNLIDQANLSPQEYASNKNGWQRLLALAKELSLKIVSPAMNYGTVVGYSEPIVWLDEFFEQPGVDIADVAAISVHNYSGYASAVKSFVEKFKKYNKPIWVTEFCAWNKDGNLKDMEFQMRYMSQTCAYFELEPLVERYAWFIPKGSAVGSENTFPYNKLLKKTNPLELTEIGKVYTNMSICNKEMFFPIDKKIDAAQYSNNNIAANIGKSGWSDTILSRPTQDTDKSSGILDIHTFKKDMWVEYQIEVVQSKNYSLSLRYQTLSSTGMSITVNGGAKTTTLNSSTWSTKTVDLGTLPVGKHIIRLSVTSGDCSLNWLQFN